MISAGFARTKITPKAGLLMGGYRLRRGGALGTHDDLSAACAVISEGGVEVALISLDLLCLQHQVVDRIRDAIFAKSNIAPEDTLIACTHTHSGPSTLGLSGKRDANDAYLAWLPDIVSTLVSTARGHMRPTKVSILQTNVPDVAFNRRIKLKDGKNAINVDKVKPQDIQAVGVTDPCVTALFFEADAITVGVLVNFTLHPTVLGEANYLYSRDYPGYLVDALQDDLPGQPVGLFLNGAFGDINQIKVPGEWIATFQEAQRIGGTIANHILQHRSRRRELKSCALSATARTICIARRSALSVNHGDTAGVSRPGGTHLSPEKDNLFHLESQSLTKAADDRVQLQLFQLGEVEIVALPGEIFVELGLEIKNRSSSPYPLVFGNANGYVGYVPTEASFNEGGYETRLSLTSRLIPEAGEIILAHIDQLRMQS